MTKIKSIAGILLETYISITASVKASRQNKILRRAAMVRVTFEKPNRFVARDLAKTDVIYRHWLKAAHFHYDDENDYYYTTSFEHAARLREFFSEPLKRKIEKVSTIEKPWAGRVLFPIGRKPKAHQLKAVQFIMTRNHSYIAYDMGLGKSAIGIMAINSYSYTTLMSGVSPKPILIVVPPSLMVNWLNELNDWKYGDYRIQTITKTGAFKLIGDPHIVLVADSLFTDSGVCLSLSSYKYSLVLVDEAQRYLGQDSFRTQFLFGETTGRGLVHRGEKVVLLSGTPMRKGPMDLYPTLKALAWNEIDFRSKHQYGLDFCAGFNESVNIGRGRRKNVWNYKGESNLDLLKEKLDNSFILREKLEDNVEELKGKLEEVVVTLDYKKTKKIQKLEDVILNGRSVVEFIDGKKDKGAISTYRAELVPLKKAIALQYVAEAVVTSPANESFLIFAHHIEMVKGLAEDLYELGPLVIMGSTPMKERDRLQKLFQSGKSRVLIANISTMVGLNLTKATRVIFVESSWSSTDNDQARSRAYRIGQNKKVLVEHLVLADTLDEYILNAVIKKKTTINKMF